MLIHRQENQLTYTTPNATITPLATPSSSATQTSVIKQRMSPAHSNPTHSHTHEEIMYLLRGSVTVTIDGQHSQLGSGDTLILPANTPHSIQNHGTQEAEWLIISPTESKLHGPDGQLMTPDWAK